MALQVGRGTVAPEDPTTVHPVKSEFISRAIESTTHEVQGIQGDTRQIGVTTAGKVVLARVQAFGVDHYHIGLAKGQVLGGASGIGNGSHRQAELTLAIGTDAIGQFLCEGDIVLQYLLHTLRMLAMSQHTAQRLLRMRDYGPGQRFTRRLL